MTKLLVTDRSLVEIGRKKAGWDKDQVPEDFVALTVQDFRELHLIQKAMEPADIMDYPLQQEYIPRFP